MSELRWLVLVSLLSLLVPWVCKIQICKSSQSTFSQGDYATDDTSNRCRFDVNINLGGWKINVVSIYLLRCNFDERAIDVVSMYFVWLNFDEQNIDVVSMYVFWPDFNGRKINVVWKYFLVEFKWKTDVTLACMFWCHFK